MDCGKGGKVWIMQAGEVSNTESGAGGGLKENARAQLWASGKHQPQTAVRSGVASWTEVHSSLRSLGSGPNTGQTLGGWDMCLPPASQKSEEEDTYSRNYQTRHAEGKPNCHPKEDVWKRAGRQNQTPLRQYSALAAGREELVA